MTTGEAAELLRSLGVEVRDAQAARRLCDYGLIEFTWTRDGGVVREDIHGRQLRGHRRVYRDSVERYAERRQTETSQESPS